MRTPEQWAIDEATTIFGTEADTKDLELEATGLDATSAAEVYYALNYLHELESANMNDQIEYILENFNFQRVQAVMGLWPRQWWSGEDGGTPTVKELKGMARKLLENAASSDLEAYATSTGGFHAHKWPWSSAEQWPNTLELIFAAEDWDA